MDPTLELEERCPGIGIGASELTLTLGDIPVADMVSLIGWTLEEFVEACADYNGEETYDWHKVITILWESTYNRIHSKFDILHKFRYYNNWKYVVTYALTLTKSHMTNSDLCDDITLQDLEEYLKDKTHNNKPILPTEPYEQKIVWTLIQVILHLYLCTQKYTQWSYPQIMRIRETVHLIQKENEDRRIARRKKKLNKKNKKNNRK